MEPHLRNKHGVGGYLDRGGKGKRGGSVEMKEVGNEGGGVMRGEREGKREGGTEGEREEGIQGGKEVGGVRRGGREGGLLYLVDNECQCDHYEIIHRKFSSCCLGNHSGPPDNDSKYQPHHKTNRHSPHV